MNQILVTGASGKTGRRVVEQLAKSGIRARKASRTNSGTDTVRFDWTDEETHADALHGVGAIYIVAPVGVVDPLPVMLPMLRKALEGGVTRFVLLSASSLEKNGPIMGAVHGWLESNVPSWVVLRPTWFMQNFSEQQHRPTIIADDAIYSATGEGRIAFIDAEDIAAVAVAALTEPQVANGDWVLTGPKAISYDEVARLITTATGRTIKHHKLTEKQLAERLVNHGIPSDFAPQLAAMDTAISIGQEDRTTDNVLKVTGRAPGSFEDFADRSAAAWTT